MMKRIGKRKLIFKVEMEEEDKMVEMVEMVNKFRFKI
jgi:hypothetical protein